MLAFKSATGSESHLVVGFIHVSFGGRGNIQAALILVSLLILLQIILAQKELGGSHGHRGAAVKQGAGCTPSQLSGCMCVVQDVEQRCVMQQDTTSS